VPFFNAAEGSNRTGDEILEQPPTFACSGGRQREARLLVDIYALARRSTIWCRADALQGKRTTTCSNAMRRVAGAGVRAVVPNVSQPFSLL
jgi:hypothetical protein